MLLTGQLFAVTIVRSPWIIASFGDATMFTSKYQSIWAIVQFRLIIYAFPISVTVGCIANDPCLCLARVFLVAFLCMGDSCTGWKKAYAIGFKQNFNAAITMYECRGKTDIQMNN